MTAPPYRPKNIEEFRESMKKLDSEERKASIEKGLQFQPRPTDVIISPFSKSGTTWLQHIVHSIRTRGGMDFKEITDVVPWIEPAAMLGYDLEAEQVASPRLFKSHLDYGQIPKGGRYIVSIRDPEKALISFYRFFENWTFEVGAFTPDVFYEKAIEEYDKPQGYWGHLLSWWEQRDNPDVLLLCYEDMLEDISPTIRMIAEFIGVELDDELFAIVKRNASREFMLEHVDKFTEYRMRERYKRILNLPDDSESSKVTTGTPHHERYRFTDETLARLKAIWKEMITDKIGFEDYPAFREALRAHVQTLSNRL